METAINKMMSAKAEFEESWIQEELSPESPPSAIESFYRNQFLEAYVLANWHAGITNDRTPLIYPMAVHHAKHLHLRHVLDYGNGIGSGALCMALVDCSITCADVADELLRFVRYRAKRHGIDV